MLKGDTERETTGAQPTKSDWRANVPSVSQLNRKIRGQLEYQFKDIWVRGELSNFRKPASGHGYGILKDASAQLRFVMFRTHLSRLPFTIKDGMELLVHGRVTVYEARGDYQIVADSMEPVGVGSLQLAFEQLKAKLKKEGLFDAKAKQPLPFLPKRIGVITSGTGAAFQDITKVLSRRFPNREIILFPTAVQGDKAPGEICHRIRQTQLWNEQHPDRPLDVLIVGRGGGSLEDLWCFNHESVARAIHECAIPIVSSVGHEIDFTIADFVADVRAATPTAAAEMIVPPFSQLKEQVDHRKIRLMSALNKSLEQYRLHVDHLCQRLVSPREMISRMKERLAQQNQRLIESMRHRLQLTRNRFETVVQKLQLLSPLQIISRGYSLSWNESGELARSLKDLPVGELMTTQVTDGKLTSRVISQETKPL